MDPLALLSNLHGDGPATLHRLRRQGCEGLPGLLGLKADELGAVLGWESVRAERFLREARSLAARLGEGLLDPEEDLLDVRPRPDAAHGSGAPARDEVLADGSAAEALEQEAEEEALEKAEEQAEDEAVPVELCAEVIERWRELDAREPVPNDVLVPRAPAPQEPVRRSLAEAGIDGLDPVRVRALIAAGIGSVEELAACDDFDLHQRTGFSFTVASRLVFLARRAAQASPAPVRGKAARLDASGPFA
jgi:hypothetical protein